MQRALVQLVEEARSDLDDGARPTAVSNRCPRPIGGVGPDRIRGRICRTVILTPTTSLLRMCKPGNYSGVAPERCLKISTAILSACRCLSNDEISNSIRAIAAINPPSTTGGSLLGLAGNSSDAVANVAGSPATPSPAAVGLLRYSLDHLRNDRMLTPSSLARSFANTRRFATVAQRRP